MARFKFYHITYIAAVILSLLAAFFSVFGFSYMFSGARDQVKMTMIFLEVVNIILVSTIPRWKYISKVYMVIFCAAILILTSLTSIGVYGYFSNAYMSTAQNITIISEEDTIIKSQISNIDAEISELRGQLSSNAIRFNTLNESRKTQDTRYSTALNKNYSTSRFREEIEKTDLELKRISENNREINEKISRLLADKLKLQKDSIETNKKIANIDIGPLRFLAKVFDCDINKVVNIIILCLTIVLHPLAIILNLATSVMMIKVKDDEIIIKSKEDIPVIAAVIEEKKIKKKRKKRKPYKKKDEKSSNINGIVW